jgi:hypothetical protein
MQDPCQLQKSKICAKMRLQELCQAADMQDLCQPKKLQVRRPPRPRLVAPRSFGLRGLVVALCHPIIKE